MPPSRPPSPLSSGAWSGPGLHSPSSSSGGRLSPGPPLTQPNGAAKTVTWSSAKAQSDTVNGYPAFAPRRDGFFGKHYRRLSQSLPRFQLGGSPRDFAQKEKLGRGRWSPGDGGWRANLSGFVRFMMRRMRLRLLIVIGLILVVFVFYLTPLHGFYRSARLLGGGNKFVIMLPANQGGGVMEWKGPREWAIERDSVKNKKNYAKKWGYHLEIVDMSTKKRYAHEWRESWEKVDTIRNSMKKYPHAEWFWWIDLHTFIMEPTYSLQSHVFKNIAKNTYRNINEYNPLNITHPFPASYIDDLSRSLEGDGKPESINIIVPQDCGGFNLGSFLIRRSAWTDRLLDIWWDPTFYEQKHMEWEHKEQDALEYLYKNQPWIRPHTAFIPQRKINSFPPGACSEAGDDPRIQYAERDRDFVVNMAGCEWGRDCWGEMYKYRQLSYHLNRSLWERFKDGISDMFKKLRRAQEQAKKE